MIYQTEVDGVPTLLAPGSGPMRAGLVFRVGVADETLPTSGITHLVEHLALYRHGVTDYHYNGMTSATETHFHVQGTPEHVVAYLSGVCDGLTNLPVERLEVEKGLLATEAAGRSASQLPRWRHGARDYGLTGYPEWGLTQLRPEDVRAWAAGWFTRGNVVLWIVGDAVPAGLRLRLPEGPRRPLPGPSSALAVTPAFVSLNTDGVRFEGLVSRGTPARMFSGVLERQLFRTLRQEGGYSYTAGTLYERRGPGTALVAALADGRPDSFDAVIGGMVDTLAALRHGRVDEADLKALVAQTEEQVGHPDADAERLPMVAVDVVTAHPVYAGEDLVDQARAVDGAAIAEVARQAWSTGLLLVPGRDASWTGFTRAAKPSTGPSAAPSTGPSAALSTGPSAAASTGPSGADPLAGGRRFKALDDGDIQFVLAAAGAGIATPTGTSAVRYDAVSALLAWPDGARQLIGLDGTSLPIEPTRFGLDPNTSGELTARVHPSRVVWMPPRDPADIPTAAFWTAQGAQQDLALDRPGAGGSVVGLVVVSVLATLATLWMLLMAAVSIDDPELGTAGGWFAQAMLWPVPLGLWFWVYRRGRRRRPRRS